MNDRTLEEIENEYWEEPEFQSHLVTTCHRLRKKQLSKFTVEDLRVMISQQISLPTLMPMAMEVLSENPLAEGDFYPGDLLKVALEVDEEWHQDHSINTQQLIEITEEAIRRIVADTDEFPMADNLTKVLLKTFENYRTRRC